MSLKVGDVTLFLIVFFSQNLFLVIWRIFQPTSLIVDQSFLICMVFFAIAFAIFKIRKLGDKFGLFSGFFGKKDKFLVTTIAVLTFSLWVLLVPGTVERSRSLSIFQWVQYGHTKHSIADIEHELKIKYDGFDMDGFRLRLHEHRVRGLLALDGQGRVVLTFGGKIIYEAAEGVASLYSLKGWYQIPLSPTNF